MVAVTSLPWSCWYRSPQTTARAPDSLADSVRVDVKAAHELHLPLGLQVYDQLGEAIASISL